ncbi:MAG: VCBS repeat-containing protein, partial [Pirellula sp.]|nr:VCBS repeat-containing protein [Pirellula sp.]
MVDIIRLNYNNHRLEAYLNNGSGSVGSRIDTTTKSFYAPNSPNGTYFSVNSGYFDDFDSDGKVDALLSGPFGATLMRGQGNGQFGDGSPSGSVTLLPQTIEWLGVGQQSGKGLDLNGDAYPDFLFGNVSSFNNLMIGLGRGDGSFDLSQYSTAFESDIGTGIVRDSQATVYASVADFNRDGVVDVLLGNTLRGQQAGSVGLMLGDQPGTFRAPQTLRNFDFISSFSPTTFGMRETVTGDFNNDGVLDLITYGAIGFGGGFYFAPGNGDGTFGKYEIVFGGVSGSNSLTTLDIDRDGNLDLAWIDGNQSRQAFGLGNGSFQALPSVPVPGGGGGFQNALQVDDFNGDDYPDLVLRLQTGNIDTNFFTRLVVLLYDPVNRRYNTLPDVNDFMTNWPRSGGFYFDEAVGIGDLNGDGKKEIFFFSRSIPSINIPARWVILETTGGPTTDASTLFRKTVIENPPFIPHDRSIYSYVVDDFDGDGINDIAYSGNHLQTTVMFGNGDFTFRDATSYYTHTFQLDSGDFNGDGVTDLVAMWGWGFLSYSVRPYQSILVGRGDGTFSEMNGFTAVDNINLAAIGDFNGDGRDDLAGTPDQTQGVAFLSRPMGVSDVASGDLNGDGTTDVVS